MPRAKLTLVLPEEVWIGAVSRAYPDARFRVLAALPGEEAGVGLVEIAASDLRDVVAAIDRDETVTALDVLARHDDEALVQFETTTPMLLFPIRRSGVPLELPFDIANGEATWEVTASRDRLSRLGDQLDAFGIAFTVDEVRDRIEPDPVLTDRQAWLVREAVARGYYDTPRSCTLTELADALDLAKSTCSEMLHRAEGAIVTEYVRNTAPRDREEPDADRSS